MHIKSLGISSCSEGCWTCVARSLSFKSDSAQKALWNLRGSERSSFSDYSTPSPFSPSPVQFLLPLLETMVSIDLDNIIHYHPPPIPKPPCKPPNLTAYPLDPSYRPSNQPAPIHPLPPRPPCLSHELPRTCHPCPQSPSTAASSSSLDPDVHLNEFDQELANLETAEFGSQETPGSCFGVSEETQAENINDTQRKEQYDQCGGK